jgi:Tfp pilus assembly protein PilF
MTRRLRYLFLVCFALALLGRVSYAQQAAAPATSPTTAVTVPDVAAPGSPAALAAAPVDPATHMIAKAIGAMNNNDEPGAEVDLTEAIRLNPKNPAAYVLRASLYCQKALWPQAEADFTAAQTLDPKNIVVKFNLVEVKFMQKQYDLARPGYVALEKDPDMGDIAVYKVFLCDLGAGHLDVAKKELDAFNDVGSKPSYYYSNAAWSLAHKNQADAQQWLASAKNIYSDRKNVFYLQGLIYMGYVSRATPTAAQK